MQVHLYQMVGLENNILKLFLILFMAAQHTQLLLVIQINPQISLFEIEPAVMSRYEESMQ